MSYARIVNGNIAAEQTNLPTSGRRLDTAEPIPDLQAATVDVQHAVGWWQVVETARPPDTATSRFVRSLITVDGIPTEQWTERVKSVEEIIQARADAHLDTLRTIRDSQGALTAAQLSNSVRAMAVIEMDLIRLVLHKLDSLD